MLKDWEGGAFGMGEAHTVTGGGSLGLRFPAGVGFGSFT